MALTNSGKTASANKQEAILYGRQLPSLLTFAVPIICGNLFQSLYNIVDAIVVGRYLGGGIIEHGAKFRVDGVA